LIGRLTDGSTPGEALPLKASTPWKSNMFRPNAVLIAKLKARSSFLKLRWMGATLALLMFNSVFSAPLPTSTIPTGSTGGTTTRTLEYRLRQVNVTDAANTLETYSTRLLGFVTGMATAQIDLLFNLPFSSATVQAALGALPGNLTALSGQPLSFTAPLLITDTRTLINQSVASSSAVLLGEQVLWVDTTELVGEDTFNLNLPALQFGPQFACVNFGNCATAFVASGDTVLLTSVGVLETYGQTRTTTSSFLTSQTYSVTGTPTAAVPQPSTWALLAWFLFPAQRLMRRPFKRIFPKTICTG
jgi:hypothetical protein